MTFVRAPFGDLATAAASSDRMPSGARVVGAASPRSSAFSCCHWQREPHRRKALLLSLHPRSRRPSWSQACSSGQRRIRCRGSASSSRARSAPRRRSLRSTLRRRPTTSSFSADEKLAQDNEQLADKAYSKYKAKADRARASAERDRWRARREEAKALRKTARGQLDDRFDFINGVSLEMSGRRLERLARMGGLIITEDVAVQRRILGTGSSYGQSYSTYTSKQLWAYESGVSAALDGTPRQHACDRDRRLGHRYDPARLRGSRTSRRSTSSARASRTASLDGRGHGSFVAGIAAGSAKDYAGVAPNAPLVSLDVMDDSGSGRTSDVIAATEWIFQNHVEYDIGVVNYSLHGGGMAHFYDDPAEQGGLEAVVRRHGRRRGGRQLRQGRGPERRALRSRQQPVRDHGRRDRHRRHGQDVRR